MDNTIARVESKEARGLCVYVNRVCVYTCADAKDVSLEFDSSVDFVTARCNARVSIQGNVNRDVTARDAVIYAHAFAGPVNATNCTLALQTAPPEPEVEVVDEEEEEEEEPVAAHVDATAEEDDSASSASDEDDEDASYAGSSSSSDSSEDVEPPRKRRVIVISDDELQSDE